ncbi:MAG: hypothetical protein ABSG15_03730 [FCB group bacterium]|jgi:hypothetical protein
MKRITCFLIALLFISTTVFSRPQYSILQSFGVKCINCHVNAQGGGARNNQGWLSRKDISLINPTSIGLGKFYDVVASTDQFLKDKFTFGFDYRLQSARFGVFSKSDRETFTMQATPYLAYNPTDWLMLEGQANLAYFLIKDHRYIGQESHAYSADFKFSDNLPRLRIGYFQPTIGTKYDDHTLLVREVATYYGNIPLIPDDYAEFGAQLDYDPYEWVSCNLGVFSSKELSVMTSPDGYTGKQIPVVDSDIPSIALRLAFFPTLGHGINTFMGGTFFFNSGFNLNSKGAYFSNNYFYISSLFFHIGLSDNLALMMEYMRSVKENSQTTNNVMAELTYQLKESVLPYFRIERAMTKEVFQNSKYNTDQYVLGVHIYLLPFIDLLPEYRIYNREFIPGYATQWAFQLHLFY